MVRSPLNAPPHQVNLMVELFHHVEAIGDNLGLRQFLAHSLAIGFPHVH